MTAAKTIDRPYIFGANLGKRLDLDALDMPHTNADGLPVVELTDEQKYTFDTLGFLVVPAVLAKEDIEEMRDFCYRLQRDRRSIPESHRSTIGGPLQRLTDHPVVVGFTNEFVAQPEMSSQEVYGFRMEDSCLKLRGADWDGKFRPTAATASFACRVIPRSTAASPVKPTAVTHAWSGN